MGEAGGESGRIARPFPKLFLNNCAMRSSPCGLAKRPITRLTE